MSGESSAEQQQMEQQSEQLQAELAAKKAEQEAEDKRIQAEKVASLKRTSTSGGGLFGDGNQTLG